ncbi:MAG: energy transducer TonB [Nitrospirae bacterium]|nr:energy transducer TonB [Nitrospirota bacterium]
MKRRLETVGSYPEIAKARRLQGEVRINFSILKDGKLGDLSLMSSSGHRILDEDAMRLLNDAAPYEAFPKEWDIEQLIIPLRVIYHINHIYVF